MKYILLIFTVLGLSQSDETYPWEKTLSKDGVVVYTRKVPSSAFKEFLAEATIKGSIEQFKTLLRDPARQPEWLPNCTETRLVDSLGPGNFTYHMMLRVPFPFENRDLVQQLVFDESPQFLEVSIINRAELVPEQDGYVRMPDIGGSWRVRELEDGMIKVQFQYFADPGGRIPPWLVNTFVVKNPYKTLTNLRRMMAKAQ